MGRRYPRVSNAIKYPIRHRRAVRLFTTNRNQSIYPDLHGPSQIRVLRPLSRMGRAQHPSILSTIIPKVSKRSYKVLPQLWHAKTDSLSTPRTFKKDEMSLSLFINHYDHRLYILLRCNYKARPYFSCRPVQDLRVTRSEKSGSTLLLSRWSASLRGYKNWAVVHMKTYEGMSQRHDVPPKKKKPPKKKLFSILILAIYFRINCTLLHHPLSQNSRKSFYPTITRRDTLPR